MQPFVQSVWHSIYSSLLHILKLEDQGAARSIGVCSLPVVSFPDFRNSEWFPIDGYRSHMEGYFETLRNVDSSSSNPGNPTSPTSPLYPEPFAFDNDFASLTAWNVVPNMVPYGNPGFEWSLATMTQPQQMHNIQFGEPSASSQIPWSHQDTSFDANASTGGVVFGPSPGPGFSAFLVGEEYLETNQREFTPQASLSPVGDDSEYDGWQNVLIPSYPNSSVPSHSSPHSESSPFSLIDTPHQTPSPRPHNNDHQHIFTTYPGITKHSQKLPRGRQRSLTTKEKQEARQVREAKACWACHLSKIKVHLYCSMKHCEYLPVTVLSVFSWLALQEVRGINRKETILPTILFQRSA